MKLYYSATSPYVRKVMVLLVEAGAADQVELIPASGTAVDQGTAPVDVNPLGKVPTLALPDGTVIYDSHVICRYLADRYWPTLYPEDDRKWPSLVLETTANGILDAAYLMVMETRVRPEGMQYPPWVEGQWAKIARSLYQLEQQVADPVLSGNLTMGQFTLAVALAYLDFRHGARNWRAGHPSLTLWYDAMAGRQSLQSTQPPV